MFFRLKKSGDRGYVQIVENKREGAAVRQTVIANLGRADDLAASGALASLLASGAKLTDQVLLIDALDQDAEGALSVAGRLVRRRPRPNAPENAAAAQGVVPRKLEFRRNANTINHLQKSSVQVGSSSD